MPYSIISMRGALANLGYRKGDGSIIAAAKEGGDGGKKPFAWEAKEGVAHPGLTGKFGHTKGVRRPNALNDLTEYCWLVYDAAFRACGDQLIGRTNDVWVTDRLDKAGLTTADTSTLWDDGAAGNIQKMDKWAPAINDAWVLGGVHRTAAFQLLSERSLMNLWDFDHKRPIVTAREILGLLHFGYRIEKGAARLVCENLALARDASLEEYDRYMRSLEGMGSNAIRAVLERSPVLEGIRMFEPGAVAHARAG